MLLYITYISLHVHSSNFVKVNCNNAAQYIVRKGHKVKLGVEKIHRRVNSLAECASPLSQTTRV